MLCRPLQAEEYGQPQEAATWDFLSLIYVHQLATEGSLAEVLHAHGPRIYPYSPKSGAFLMSACQYLHFLISWSALWWLETLSHR